MNGYSNWKPSKYLLLSGLILAGLISADAAIAKTPDLDRLAQELARLRSEVNQLQQKLDQAKTHHHHQMEALGAQIAQLEAEKRRQVLSVKKLEANLEDIRRQVPADQVTGAELVPALQHAIGVLNEYIQSSLPFKRKERLQAVDAIANKLDQGTVPPKKLANQLWALVEDELRLTRENGLYRQTVSVNGQNALVDTAKLGMTLLYFRTPDGRYGMARRKNEEWRFEVTANPEDSQRIEHLMESLRKQIRQGYFELPNPGYQ
ncbi:DUF3450 family protein [Methylohalobius crimeensis]|uniref:DUF3450 family protein n=1 Tax=Methylohalobius crimeensis TaxID=244365 RepID=UPI0003B54AD4|nr:DUF3450 family protein [Methylohalobius crimeensis]